MKRIHTLLVTIFLSIFLVVSVNAAPAGTSTTANNQLGLKNTKKAMQGKLEHDKQVNIPLGLQNAKKAMQGKLEHDKQVSKVREKGQSMRKQALKEK